MENCASTGNQSTKKHDFVEQQLHLQFAENYNQISSYVVTFIVGILVALSPLGWCSYKLLLNYYFLDGSSLVSLPPNLILFTGSVILAFAICLIIAYISIKQGWAVRRDQFIIYAIRYNYYKDLQGNPQMSISEGGIFPPDYWPFDKKGVAILVGVFGQLYQIALYSVIVILIASCFLLRFGNVIIEISDKTIFCHSMLIILLVFGVWILITQICIRKIETKYNRLNELFKHYLNISKTK